MSFIQTMNVKPKRRQHWHPRKCSECGEEVSVRGRRSHMEIKHPEILVKKKYWKYFTK